VDLDRDAILPTFLGEAEENLVALEAGLLGLDRAANRDDAIAEIFRTAHTLKGNAESLGLDAMGACAHALESVLDSVRKGTMDVTPALVNALLGGHDALQSMLATLARGGTPDVAAHEDVIQTMTEAAAGELGAGKPSDPVLFAHFGRKASQDPARRPRDPRPHPDQYGGDVDRARPLADRGRG
jgi:two-component system chemotaxis sensor kinase CheA